MATATGAATRSQSRMGKSPRKFTFLTTRIIPRRFHWRNGCLIHTGPTKLAPPSPGTRRGGWRRTSPSCPKCCVESRAARAGLASSAVTLISKCGGMLGNGVLRFCGAAALRVAVATVCPGPQALRFASYAWGSCLRSGGRWCDLAAVSPPKVRRDWKTNPESRRRRCEAFGRRDEEAPALRDRGRLISRRVSERNKSTWRQRRRPAREGGRRRRPSRRRRRASFGSLARARGLPGEVTFS